MGSRKQRIDMKRQLDSEPVMSGTVIINPKENFKYLGQILSSYGLSASVADTVRDREGKIRGAALEAIQIVNDW